MIFLNVSWAFFLCDNRQLIRKTKDDDSKSFEKLKKSEFEAGLRYLEISEKAQYLNLRKQWSKHIKVAFWIILSSALTFISLLGLDILDYSKYTGLPQVILGAFFLNIVGLAFIVAKFLFPNPKK